MKIIYSFWTKPFFEKKEDGFYSNGWHGPIKPTTQALNDALNRNAKYYHTSAKCARKIGYKIELYTDNKGAELIGNANFFDNINTELEDLKDEAASLWSVAKIFSLKRALEKEDNPVVHIDSDIFFHNGNLINEKINSNWDIFVQSKEYAKCFEECYERDLSFFLNVFFQLYPPIEENAYNFLKKYFQYSYNCGFLGFKNKDIASRYFNNYYEIYKKISNPSFLKIYFDECLSMAHYINNRKNSLFSPQKSRKLNINCILEQIQLVNFSNYHNLYTKELIPINEWDSNQLYEGRVKSNQKLGYMHFCGNNKYYKDEIYNKIISEYDIY